MRANIPNICAVAGAKPADETIATRPHLPVALFFGILLYEQNPIRIAYNRNIIRHGRNLRIRRFGMLGLGAAALLWGCAEPNSPTYPSVKYALRQISLTRTPGWAQDVWVDGSLAYIADDERGVTIVDVSHIGNPVIADTIPTVKNAMAVRGVPEFQLLFVDEDRVAGYELATKQVKATPWEGGVLDLDVRDIGNGQILIAEVNEKEGWFAFTLLEYDTIRTFWMPTGGVQLWPNPRFGWFRGADMDSNWVYLAHGQSGLDCYSMTYTGGNYTMTFWGNVDTPGAAYDAAHTADGNYVAVADMQGGLVMIDVSDKSAPRMVGSLIPEKVNGASQVWVQGDTAYFFDDFNGIYAADISDPTAPRLTAFFETPNPKGMFVTEDHTIFVADQDAGLYILRWN